MGRRLFPQEQLAHAIDHGAYVPKGHLRVDNSRIIQSHGPKTLRDHAYIIQGYVDWIDGLEHLARSREGTLATPPPSPFPRIGCIYRKPSSISGGQPESKPGDYKRLLAVSCTYE